MDSDFIAARKAAILTQIEAYETAIAALSSGILSYTIDTGQTRQNVTQQNLTELRNALSSAISMYDYYCNLDGTSPTSTVVGVRR